MTNLGRILILSGLAALSSVSAFATGQGDSACDAQQTAPCGDGPDQKKCKATDIAVTVDPNKPVSTGAIAPPVVPPVTPPATNSGH